MIIFCYNILLNKQLKTFCYSILVKYEIKNVLYNILYKDGKHYFMTHS